MRYTLYIVLGLLCLGLTACPQKESGDDGSAMPDATNRKPDYGKTAGDAAGNTAGTPDAGGTAANPCTPVPSPTGPGDTTNPCAPKGGEGGGTANPCNPCAGKGGEGGGTTNPCNPCGGKGGDTGGSEGGSGGDTGGGSGGGTGGAGGGEGGK